MKKLMLSILLASSLFGETYVLSSKDDISYNTDLFEFWRSQLHKVQEYNTDIAEIQLIVESDKPLEEIQRGEDITEMKVVYTLKGKRFFNVLREDVDRYDGKFFWDLAKKKYEIEKPKSLIER